MISSLLQPLRHLPSSLSSSLGKVTLGNTYTLGNSLGKRMNPIAAGPIAGLNNGINYTTVRNFASKKHKRTMKLAKGEQQQQQTATLLYYPQIIVSILSPHRTANTCIIHLHHHFTSTTYYYYY